MWFYNNRKWKGDVNREREEREAYSGEGEMIWKIDREKKKNHHNDIFWEVGKNRLYRINGGMEFWEINGYFTMLGCIYICVGEQMDVLLKIYESLLSGA